MIVCSSKVHLKSDLYIFIEHRQSCSGTTKYFLNLNRINTNPPLLLNKPADCSCHGRLLTVDCSFTPGYSKLNLQRSPSDVKLQTKLTFQPHSCFSPLLFSSLLFSSLLFSSHSVALLLKRKLYVASVLKQSHLRPV